MKSNNYILGGIAIILLLSLGGIIGYKLKKCPIVNNTVYSTDTVYQGYPIIDTYRTSYPINKPYFISVPSKPVNVHDTVFLEDYAPSFESIDTLRYQDLYVSIKDKGNCTGIIERQSVFGGNLKERIITNEIKTILQAPIPFLTLHAGVSASFSNRWKAFDVGPAASIVIRQRHIINYNYGINTSTHNFSLQTKIK